MSVYGKVTATNSPRHTGQTMLMFCVCQRQSEQPDRPQTSTPQIQAAGERPLVALVLDNDMLQARCTSRILQARGCEVTSFDEIADAVAWYAEHRPDVVFLDMHMPPVHAMGVIEQLRGIDPNVKAVVITAFEDSMPELTRNTHAAGPFAFIRKEDLLAQARELLLRVRHGSC